MKNMKVGGLIVLALVLMCSVMDAVPITGGLSFYSTTGPNIGSVTQTGGTLTLHFNSDILAFNSNGRPNNSYGNIQSQPVTFSDVSLTPIGSHHLMTVAVAGETLWTFSVGQTTYSFNFVDGLNGYNVFGALYGTQLKINGPGLAHIDGFNDTPYYLFFTGYINSDFSVTQGHLAIQNLAVSDVGSTGLLSVLSIGAVGIFRSRWARSA
jgi:hypothetical protein